MKNTLVIMAIFVVASAALSQTQPQAYLERIPALPANPCQISEPERQAFLEKVNALEDEIQSNSRKQKKSLEANYQKAGEETKKKYATELGISNADMEKINSNKMTKEEKKALAAKVLREKMGVSMSDLQNMKKASKDDPKSVEDAMAAAKKLNAQATPAMVGDPSKATNQVELLKRQSALTEKIGKADEKYAKQMADLEKMDAEESKKLEAKRKPLMDQYYQEKNMESVVKQVRAMEKEYCGKMSTKLTAILKERLTSVKALMPDYAELEEVNAQLNQSTLATGQDLSARGLMGVAAVEDYVSSLKSAFKYIRNTFPEDGAGSKPAK